MIRELCALNVYIYIFMEFLKSFLMHGFMISSLPIEHK